MPARVRRGIGIFLLDCRVGKNRAKTRKMKDILSESYINFTEKPRKLAEFPKFSGFYFCVLRKFVIKKFGALHLGLYLCTRHLTATPDTKTH